MEIENSGLSNGSYHAKEISSFNEVFSKLDLSNKSSNKNRLNFSESNDSGFKQVPYCEDNFIPQEISRRGRQSSLSRKKEHSRNIAPNLSRENSMIEDYFRDKHNVIRRVKGIDRNIDLMINTLLKMSQGWDLEQDDFLFELDYKDVFLSIIKKQFDDADLIRYMKKSIEGCSEAMIKLNRVLNTKSYKRQEERDKFLFKLTINHFKEEFFKNNKLQRKSTVGEIRFWEYHFNTYCNERSDITLSEVFDPLNAQYVQNSRYKTLEKDYLRIIFENERFKDMFFEFLDTKLKTKYSATMHGKYLKVFKPFRDRLKKEPESIWILKNAFADNIESKKSKLPWVHHEIDVAIRKFKKKINNKVLS